MVLTTSKVGPTPYYLPRVQPTLAHARALFLSNTTPPSSTHTTPSSEVAKAAADKFKACIGGGAILSAEVMLQIMADTERETEQKKLEEQRRIAHRVSQKPTWEALLVKAKAQHLAEQETTLNNRGMIPLAVLKEWCKKLQLVHSGTQTEVANRLLSHLGIVGELIRYVVEENEEDQ